MAESAVSFLLDNFSSLLQNEINRLRGLGPEVKSILDQLEQMRAFLRVADSKEQDDPQLEVWTRQVREIAYDFEDVLDEYKLLVANHRTNGFTACITKIYGWIKGLKHRREIASQIQTIKSRVENASQSYERYKDVYPIMDQGPTYDGRGDALLLEEGEVVGIENPKRQLFQWLKSSEGGLKVISVIGMGGMGKTTLVKKIYDDNSLKDAFQHHVWITVSESYKIEDLLAKMIKLLVEKVKQPTPPPLEYMNADEMREFIYKFLQDKTYLVVLDDVWKIDAWEAFKYAFPRSMAKSQGCIIITTRFNSIANSAGSDAKSYVYNLAPLTIEDSKLLFYKRAFPRNSCPLHLKEISESILKRCGGLPLAIVVIGGLLATKNNNIQEWEMFNRNIGDELEGDNLKRLKKLISLSFYDLPYYLKSCFLYLSLLPEDAEFDKVIMIRLWVAEGFVQEKRGKTMEEVAEDYLNELANRSLIQVVKKLVDGTVRNFRIHDLLREYIISKTKGEILVVGDRGDVRWHDKIRRIALNNASSNNMQESYTFEHLRSLMWFSSEDSSGEVTFQKVLGRRCRLLTVMLLARAPLKSIPGEVFKLYHLKYLSLLYTEVEVIPKSIKNLVNLETLDLNDGLVMQLPIEIVKLKKLRHLVVSGYLYTVVFGAKYPTGIGSLTSLQTLKHLSAEDAKKVREIGKLTQLRELGLTDVRTNVGNDLCSSISKLSSLRELYLSSFNREVIDLEHPMMFSSSFPFLRILRLEMRLHKIPIWAPSLVGLTVLILEYSRIMEDQDLLELIQGLPNLLSLELVSAYEGEGLTFRTGGFQRLKKLKLVELEKLRWVKVEEGCMPHLEKLYMEDCKLMAEVPEGLQHVLHLQNAKFLDMSKEFVTRVDQKRKGKKWELDHVSKLVVH